MSNIKVELVTPDALLYSSEAGYVSLPAKEGEMGILPNHAPMVVSLGGGLLTICDAINTEPKVSFFILNGTAQVTEKTCTILADEAIDLKEYSIDQANLKLAFAQSEFDKNSSGLKSIEFQEKLNIVQKLVDAL